MKINRIEIKGFKSIDHLVLENVSPLMVLAGANGSGKSNLADAMAFFGHVIQNDLRSAVKAFGGVQSIKNYKLKTSAKALLSLKININLDNTELEYSMEISLQEDDYKIQNEILTENGTTIFDRAKLIQEIQKCSSDMMKNLKANAVIGAVAGGILGAASDKDTTLSNILSGATIGAIGGGVLTLLAESNNFLSPTSPVIQQEFIQNNLIGKYLSNIRIFRINPVEAKKSSPFGSKELESNGSNIAAVLAAWEKQEDFREQTMEWLQLIVPNMEAVHTETQKLDNSTKLSFREKGVSKRFPAGLISDGTIYTLCILTAVLSRTHNYGITIIEEPERGIHPQAIGELMSLMRSLSGDKHMILLTTHSESVVRNAEISEIYFAEKPESNTSIRSVANSGVDKTQIPLDTAWLSNLFDGGLPW